jgi:D-alanine-D-alanine ligase
MGGWSSERPVSLSSGNACADALEAEGFRVTRVDVKRDIADLLSQLRPDVAFNALHGPYGEDGCIQGILEILEIPYTHSGVLASALAMNKPKAKDVMKAAGIPVSESVLVHRLEAARSHVIAPPYVVKPPNEGSSRRIIVNADAPHPPQQLYADDWPHGEIVMVERYAAGRELTCGFAAISRSMIDILTEDRFTTTTQNMRRVDQNTFAGATFTRCLPKYTDAGATGPSGTGLSWGRSSDFRYDDRPSGTGE